MLMALFGPRGTAVSSLTSRQVWFVIYSLGFFCSFLIESFCGVSLWVHLRLHSGNESHKLMIRFILFNALLSLLCFVKTHKSRQPSWWWGATALSDEMALSLNPVWHGRFKKKKNAYFYLASVIGWSGDFGTKNSPRTWHRPGVCHKKNIGGWRCDRTSPKQV